MSLALPAGHRGSQSLKPGPSDFKANVLYSEDPHFHDFMWQEFPGSFQLPGFWVNLSNRQLRAKKISKRISGRETQETVKRG